MVRVAPFSVLFWLCYLFGGLSDIIDGWIARSFNQQSAVGAKLDSIADMVFAGAIIILAVGNLVFPNWIWIAVAGIAAIRITGYLVGLYKFRTFSSLHTYLNKVTGALIFAFPLLYPILGMTNAGIILCLVAAASSLEELIITVKSKELTRDCKTILFN